MERDTDIDRILKEKTLEELGKTDRLLSSGSNSANILAAQLRTYIQSDLANLHRRLGLLETMMQNEYDRKTTENALLTQQAKERDAILRTLNTLNTEEEKENKDIDMDFDAITDPRSSASEEVEETLKAGFASLDGSIFVPRVAQEPSQKFFKIPMASLDESICLAKAPSQTNSSDDFRLPELPRPRKVNLGQLPSPPKLSHVAKQFLGTDH